MHIFALLKERSDYVASVLQVTDLEDTLAVANDRSHELSAKLSVAERTTEVSFCSF